MQSCDQTTRCHRKDRGGHNFHQFYAHADVPLSFISPYVRLAAAVFSSQTLQCMCVLLCDSGRLTQAAELTDNGGERVVHHTLQLAADALGELPSAEVTGVDVPLHQRHGGASLRPNLLEKHRKLYGEFHSDRLHLC